VSSGGQRGKPRPDASAAASAPPSGAPGGGADSASPEPGPSTGSASPGPGPSTGSASPGPGPSTGSASPEPGRATGAFGPIPVTGTASEAEGYAAAARAELPEWPVALTGLALVAAVLLAEGYLAAGPAGFVVAGTVLALVAILFVRATMPHAEHPPPGTVRKDHRSGDSSEADFPGYRKITSDLSWAAASPRHYDHGLRRQLAGLLDARLAQRYGLDAAAQPERARELVGAELWPLLDTSRPPSNDSRGPGVSMATVDRIVTRLEEL
jgi:hypothetical protein